MIGILTSLLIGLTVPKETLRFTFVYEQTSDTSCGFSATATLLNMYWEISISEKELLQKYRNEENSSLEISLAEISRILSDFGCRTKSFKMDMQQITQSIIRYAPALVHFSDPDGHFALVLAVEGNNVIVADPARGVELVALQRFEKRWSGAVLLCVVPGKTCNQENVESAVKSALIKNKNLIKWAR